MACPHRVAHVGYMASHEDLVAASHAGEANAAENVCASPDCQRDVASVIQTATGRAAAFYPFQQEHAVSS